MLNKVMIGLIGLILIGCSSNSDVSVSKVSSVPVNASMPVKSAASDPVMLGGWAPVFFTGFDKSQLDNIVAGINQGRIKRAVVSYPTRMQTLAGKIHDYLQQQTQQTIAMKSVELKDTDQVKYDLKQVIVTLYFN
ncbi:MAG: hypothetical protein K2Y14_04825 [Burkholderiales bacterium]|nr:hypothetical protein [Burkholderiales bacterium]